GAVLTPGLRGMPSLPWELQVSRQSNNQLLLTRTISTLPQWLVLLGNNVFLSDSPVLGPAGPPCASSYPLPEIVIDLEYVLEVQRRYDGTPVTTLEIAGPAARLRL